MGERAKGNLVVAQGGGPTPVINCSLYGAVVRAAEQPGIGRVFGARFGITGLLNESFVDVLALPRAVLDGLRRTPAAALGSCRYKVKDDDYPRILDTLRRNEIRYFLYIGGNDSMDTADRVHRLARDEGYELSVIGIPKTIDNDLPLTDRCPGFGSAARYVAQSVRDVGMDVRSLPTPVSIFETMGRNAGWLAGASALARIDPDSAPHLIHLPERAFEPAAFLANVEGVVRRLGWAVVVVSEGLRRSDGEPVYACESETQVDAFGHPLSGDVGACLAGLVSRELKLRCRSEKPGLCGRSSMLYVSPVDRQDAETVGAAGVELAVAGQSGKMVTLLPLNEGAGKTGSAPLAEVANSEKLVPDDWIAPSGSFVTEAFCDYVRPLIGPDLMEYTRLC